MTSDILKIIIEAAKKATIQMPVENFPLSTGKIMKIGWVNVINSATFITELEKHL